MVQKLLCRWWYAMEWPAKGDLRPAPASYEALEGYPGVFICVEVSAGGVRRDVVCWWTVVLSCVDHIAFRDDPRLHERACCSGTSYHRLMCSRSSSCLVRATTSASFSTYATKLPVRASQTSQTRFEGIRGFAFSNVERTLLNVFRVRVPKPDGQGRL